MAQGDGGWLIYIIQNLVNGKCYVGQTKSLLKSRWWRHCRDKRPIGLAIRKYGEWNFKVSILAKMDSQEAANLGEEAHIALCNSLAPKGYNLHPGGRNHAVHPKTKLKISNTGKGHLVSKETRTKIGITQRGRIRPSELRARISASLKGRPGHSVSVETRLKLHNAGLGNKACLGRSLSTESKLRISQSLRRFYAELKDSRSHL